MADAILKSSAIERSYDNLTIVIIAFKNFLGFYENAKKRQNEGQSNAMKIEIESQTPRRPAQKLTASMVSKVKNSELQQHYINQNNENNLDKNNTLNSLQNKLQSYNTQGFNTTKAKIPKETFNSNNGPNEISAKDNKKMQRESISAHSSQNRFDQQKIKQMGDQICKVSKQIKLGEIKRNNSSNQQDRDYQKQNEQGIQQNLLQKQPSIQNQINIDRKKSSDQALLPSQNQKIVQTQNNKYTSRESRNKKKKQDEISQFFNNDSSLMGQQNSCNQNYKYNYGLSENEQMNPLNTASTLMNNRIGQLNSRNQIDQILKENSFKNKNKDAQVNIAKNNNKLMLEQQTKRDNEFQQQNLKYKYSTNN